MASGLLATRFKNRRLELNMSQAEVAEGICKQARISRIERGNYSPGAELLYQLAKKLNVSVEYFFDKNVEEKSESLDNFRELTRKLLDESDYENLKYLYELEVSKVSKLTISDQVYLSWIGAMVDFYVDNKKNAITKLEKTLQQVSEKDILYLVIANTLLNFFLELDDTKAYEKCYEETSLVFNKIKATKLEEVYTIIRFRYNYSLYLYSNDKNQKALEELMETIEFCKKHRVSYALGDLYCLLGDISEDFKEIEEVKKFYKKAIFYYEEDKNEKLALKVEQHLKENY